MSKIEVNQISSQCGSTLTIGQSGDTVTLACGATQTGFGRTGTVDWDTTAKTASFTAVSGNGYFVNTTSGAITVTLPAGSAGSIVSLKDYANTWQTNNVTVTPNGTDKINGTNDSAILNTQDQSVTLVYVDSTKGWRAVQDSTSDVSGLSFIEATGGTITECGNCRIHTFTGPGTFCVSAISNTSDNNTVSYTVVAGGGGGGGQEGSGGGGAGGFREYKSPVTCYTASPLNGNPGGTAITVTATAFPITVGAGGAGGINQGTCQKGFNGNNSIFSTVISTGGGGGGSHPGPLCGPGNNGGSGGGGGSRFDTPGGNGNTPPVSPSQGFSGGSSVNACTPSSIDAGGGGGGATGAGGNASANAGGTGGPGATTSISGTPTGYAGGGGGGVDCLPGPGPSTPGTASDGGGAGGPYPGGSGISGTANTGGGGGGSTKGGPFAPFPCSGGSGGSGIVIIRYKFQ